MKILDVTQIKQKIRRLAYEILENNFAAKKIYLVGINNNGYHFALLLKKELEKLSEKSFELIRLRLNPASPTEHPIELEVPGKQLHQQNLIVVDDVANTGRTLFYALKPLLNILPKKVEMAVLVDRKHKAFPIKVDYMGLSLATTLKENIEVNLKPTKQMAVELN